MWAARGEGSREATRVCSLALCIYRYIHGAEYWRIQRTLKGLSRHGGLPRLKIYAKFATIVIIFLFKKKLRTPRTMKNTLLNPLIYAHTCNINTLHPTRAAASCLLIYHNSPLLRDELIYIVYRERERESRLANGMLRDHQRPVRVAGGRKCAKTGSHLPMATSRYVALCVPHGRSGLVYASSLVARDEGTKDANSST